ncbi:MAG: hypothetical protein GX448_16175 [Planctomycetes bacterium]|nr:hypothetical protein [Planctomycetota bacterium]
MGKRFTAMTLCVLAAIAMAGSTTHAGDPTLIGWWKLNDGAGTTAADFSGNGHNGTIVNPNGGLGAGGSVWVNDPERGMVISFNGTDGTGACVNPALTIPAMTLQNDFTWIFWAKQPAAQATNNDTMLGNRYGGTASPLQFIKFTPTRFECYNDDGSYINGINYNSIPSDVWIHHALVKDGASLTYYRNGVPTLTNTMTKTVAPNPFYMGADGYSGVVEAWQGYLSDVRLYERALTQGEVLKVMAGKGPGAELAGDPVPAEDAKDVPQDVVLSWTPGEFAATHDVYLGTSLDDVTDASRADTKGVLVSQGQAAASYDGETLLEFGTVYHWRVDEVNAAPDNAIFKGDVWSFTVEPFSYPIKNVTATASSQSRADTGPQNTVNGSGLNASDQHSIQLVEMWMSGNTKPHWIQYQFDKAYKLDQMWVWNANQVVEAFVGFGAKDVTIEYSADGATWETLAGPHEFARGTGDASYTANTKVDFGGVTAQFVKLTINSNWGGVTPQVSLSEVRFHYVPVQARQPQPADAATGVLLTSSLNWRPGREATSHKVFFGTDPDAVAAGTAASSTVTDHVFTPAALTFGAKYFWKVDEIGGDGPYAGPVWSFTAQEFSPLEDFEGYTDDEGSRLYEAWLDGIADAAYGGSTVGYMTAPFAERTIVHGGRQSMPLAYDNTKTPFFSEAVKEFDTPQNCTGSGASELCVWTRGYPALATTAVTETGGKMTLTGTGADIWNNSDEFTYAYKTLSGDGSMVARVTSIGPGSNTWAKGGVMIRDSINGGSTHAMMIMTANTDGAAGNGASFQYRSATNGASANADSSTVIKAPYWVRIERAGSTLSGYTSADGKTWSLMGQTVIEMADPVLIGICATSHAAGEERTFQFESIAATGNVSGTWQGAIINAAQYNDAAPMYLTVTDSAGKSATATSDTAANVANWTRWTIPMSSLNGVNFSRVKKLTIGVGAKNATTGGSGMVFIDDIGFGQSSKQ